MSLPNHPQIGRATYDDHDALADLVLLQEGTPDVLVLVRGLSQLVVGVLRPEPHGSIRVDVPVGCLSLAAILNSNSGAKATE